MGASMISTFKKLFRKPAPAGVDATYIALVAAARNPFFYADLGVPDSIDGRFEMIVLHLFLLQQRLLDAPEACEFARQLSEAFFDDMDRSVRELGVADTGVSKRIKRMGKAYHGRLLAYRAGLDDAVALRAALARNLYGTVKEGDVALLERMAQYVHAQVEQLQTVPTPTITNGQYSWTNEGLRAAA